jgi:NADPH2:quinone reductase
MRAITVDGNKDLHWTDVPEPMAGADEVLLAVHAAGLNRADLLQRAGTYPPPPGWPEWMGLEVAGSVLSAPPGSRWQVGDKVCALLGGGGYAERIAVPEAMILPVPAGLSMAEAASLPESFATSYLNLVLEADLKRGETTLIHAGASGLGIAALQMAKAFGAKVITTVGSEEKAEAVRRLGADVVVNRKTKDLGRVLDENPVDVVLDCVGGADLGRHLEKLAPGGRWILIATLGGESAEIALRPILKRGLRLIGSTLRSRSTEMKGRILADLERRVWPSLESGAIRPLVFRTFPMTCAAEAHAILARHENIGKVVLTVP